MSTKHTNQLQQIEREEAVALMDLATPGPGAVDRLLVAYQRRSSDGRRLGTTLTPEAHKQLRELKQAAELTFSLAERARQTLGLFDEDES